LVIFLIFFIVFSSWREVEFSWFKIFYFFEIIIFFIFFYFFYIIL
jgi:hypothetical protein